MVYLVVALLSLILMLLVLLVGRPSPLSCCPTPLVVLPELAQWES